MGGSPSGTVGTQIGFAPGTKDPNTYGTLPGGFDWGNLFGGPAAGSTKPFQLQNPVSPLARRDGSTQNQQGGVGSLDWMKWHPDYQATPGTAAWGATHPDPAQNVKYGSAQWQQTHPNYQANQMIPGQLGQPPNDLSEVIKHMFGGGQ